MVFAEVLAGRNFVESSRLDPSRVVYRPGKLEVEARSEGLWLQLPEAPQEDDLVGLDHDHVPSSQNEPIPSRRTGATQREAN